MLFRLTEKAKQYLEKLGYLVRRDRNGIEHRFWKWKVAAYYRKKGYKVFIEKRINGAVDVAVKKDNLSIAIEIETGTSDSIKNIKVPILLIHSERDSQIPVKHAHTLKKANPKAELWIIGEADHGGVWGLMRSKYEERILNFLLSATE